MRHILTSCLVIVLLFCASSCPAQTGPIVITDLPIAVGDYYLVIRREVDGSVRVERIAPQNIAMIGGDPTDPIDPTDPSPPTGPHAALRKVVQNATDAVVDPNKVNAQRAISTLYSSISALPFETRSALVRSTDLMFNALGLGPPWKPWKEAVDGALELFVPLPEAVAAWRIVAEVLK